MLLPQHTLDRLDRYTVEQHKNKGYLEGFHTIIKLFWKPKPYRHSYLWGMIVVEGKETERPQQITFRWTFKSVDKLEETYTWEEPSDCTELRKQLADWAKKTTQ